MTQGVEHEFDRLVDKLDDEYKNWENMAKLEKEIKSRSFGALRFMIFDIRRTFTSRYFWMWFWTMLDIFGSSDWDKFTMRHFWLDNEDITDEQYELIRKAYICKAYTKKAALDHWKDKQLHVSNMEAVTRQYYNEMSEFRQRFTELWVK